MLLVRHVLFILVMAGMSHGLTKVSVLYGQVSVAGYQKCEITHNNEVLEYTGPEKKVLPGLRFGLISYNCDNHVGHLISPFECKQCGFFCSYNEYIQGCQQEDVPFWLGITAGLILAGGIGGLLFYCFYKYVDSRNNYPTDKRSKITILTCDGSKDEFTFDAGKEALDESGLEPFVPDNLPSSFQKRPKSAPTGSAGATGLKVLITGLLLNKSANACDLTFTMSSNQVQRVCNNTYSCQDTPVYEFPFSSGQEVCFEDLYGEIVALSVSKIYVRSRYELAYFTSDYKVANLSTLSNVQCRSADSSCYHSDYRDYNCYADALAKLNAEAELKDYVAPQGWACNVLRNARFGVYSCCRYFWQVERIGELHPVYSKISQIWEAKFNLRKKNVSQEVVFSAYDPATVLSGLALKTVDSLHISILNFSSPRIPKSQNSLVGYKDELYFVNASLAHRPKSYLFGDYQTSLSKSRDFSATPENITCRQIDPNLSSDCRCSCNFPEIRSAIRKFEKNVNNVTSLNNFLKRGENSVIDIFQEVDVGTFHMKLGDWNIEDSPIKRGAKCDIDLGVTYGCAACNESAYIVMEPRNVEIEGLVPFHSNCSFDKEYVKCDLEPVKLTLKGVYDYCFVKMPTLNKTMLIHVQYLDLGHQINPSGNIRLEENFGENARHLIASEHFKRALIFTLPVCLFLELLLIFVYFKIVKRHKNKADSVKETPLVPFYN